MAGTCRLELAQHLRSLTTDPQGRWNGDGSCGGACWLTQADQLLALYYPWTITSSQGRSENKQSHTAVVPLGMGQREPLLRMAPTTGNTGGIMSRLGFCPALPSGCPLSD